MLVTSPSEIGLKLWI